MSASPTIRRASAGDAEALSLVGSATFLDSYAEVLPGPDIVRHCAVNQSPAVFARWLSDPNCAVWAVEVAKGEVGAEPPAMIGYSVLTPPDLPGAIEGDIELRRIYLLSRFQGGGMGRRLMEAAVQEAGDRRFRRLLLGVYGENHRALAFYRRMGFAEIGTREFWVGTKCCSDFVLARTLD